MLTQSLLTKIGIIIGILSLLLNFWGPNWKLKTKIKKIIKKKIKNAEIVFFPVIYTALHGETIFWDTVHVVEFVSIKCCMKMINLFLFTKSNIFLLELKVSI